MVGMSDKVSYSKVKEECAADHSKPGLLIDECLPEKGDSKSSDAPVHGICRRSPETCG